MLGPSDLAARSKDGAIELRTNALRIDWPLSDLQSSDSRTFTGQFSCLIRALESPVEQKMFREALLDSHPVVGIREVSALFTDAIAAAARTTAAQHDADSLYDVARGEVLAAILIAAKTIAFISGVEFLPPFTLDLDCPSFRQESQRSDRLRAAGELFAKFQALRAAAPGLPAGRILQDISPADQPQLLRAILLSQAEDRDAQKLFAASGDVVFEISKDLSESPRTARISRDPLRSIRPGDDGELLLGSRGGVTRFRENSEQPPLFFADPGIAAQTGFNAAAVSSGRLWATHAEAGVVAWNIEQPQSPFLRIKDSAVPAKNLAILPSGNAIFSSGPRVLVAAPGGSLNPVGPESKAEIIALFVRPPKLLVITADGRVCVCNLQNFQLEQERHHARPVSAAALLPWLDDFRILLAEESGAVACIGLDDEVCTRYSSPHLGCRMLAASASRIAAVSPDRQRLILWNTWEGRFPAGELHLGAIAKHRITDIAFI